MAHFLHEGTRSSATAVGVVREKRCDRAAAGSYTPVLELGHGHGVEVAQLRRLEVEQHRMH